MTYGELPTEVRDAVADLAREIKILGGRLFVFGSFASGTARPTSDLDLAFELPSAVNKADYVGVFRAIDELPTVRAVELLDLRHATPAFRRNLQLVEIAST
jgi:hypothetical protein